jgi:hypothetical protein
VTNPKVKRLLNAVAPGEPSPKCPACGTARLELAINTEKTTLAHLVDKVRSPQPCHGSKLPHTIMWENVMLFLLSSDEAL